jgi:hypothetical protein
MDQAVRGSTQMNRSGEVQELKAIHWLRILKMTTNNGLALPLRYHRPEIILTLGSHETFAKKSHHCRFLKMERLSHKNKLEIDSKNNINKRLK